MVSALDSGLSGPGSRPGRGHCVVFMGRHFTPTVPLSTQVCKCVPAHLMLGVTLRWTSIPSRGGVEICLVASCYRNRDKLWPDGPLGWYSDFFFLHIVEYARKITIIVAIKFRGNKRYSIQRKLFMLISQALPQFFKRTADMSPLIDFLRDFVNRNSLFLQNIWNKIFQLFLVFM